MTVKVADPLLMREINKNSVLEAIRRHGRISRVEISKYTLLSGTTVSAITSALLQEGLIQAIHTKSSADSARGRPRVFLELIPDAAYVIGIMIAVDSTTTTLANFRGEVISSVQVPVRVSRWESDVIVDLIEGSAREIIAKSNIPADKIKGIGIGIPGIVDPSSGRSHSSPVFGARDLPIGKLLEERMHINVRIDKPSNLVALAESWFGLAQQDDSFAVVTLDDTAGLSLVLGGELHRGASALGPTFAHVKVGSEGRKCECGQIDCLNTYVSTSALVRHLRQSDSDLQDLDRLNNSRVIKQICAEAKAGNKKAKDGLLTQAKMLGLGVSHVINIANPARIIIGVEDATHQEAIETALHESLKQNCFDAHLKNTEINFDIFDEKLWASGAAALVLKDIYSSPWTA